MHYGSRVLTGYTWDIAPCALPLDHMEDGLQKQSTDSYILLVSSSAFNIYKIVGKILLMHLFMFYARLRDCKI